MANKPISRLGLMTSEFTIVSGTYFIEDLFSVNIFGQITNITNINTSNVLGFLCRFKIN